ncbi:MAG: glycosyltransferase family 2 protein [Cyanobacteria bacterium J06598_1]
MPCHNPLVQQPLFFLSVNYRSAALLAQLISSLPLGCQLIIVNNSPDDSSVHGLVDLAEKDQRVVVLDADENGGFGAGCNLGLDWIYTRSPQALVWLINPDAQLLPEAESTVRQCFASQPNTAILGTPILDTQGQLWFGSGHFNRWTGAVTSHHRAISATTLAPTDWVSGCSMVLNLQALGHLPQFDEVYFLYYEDCDLCDRYRQQGYAIALTPIPLVSHAVSSITSRHTQAKYEHATFSKLMFLHRRATPLALGLNIIYLLTQALWLGLHNRASALGRWIGFKRFLTAAFSPVEIARTHANHPQP